MKLNKLWAGALVLLGLTACGKDLEPSFSPSELEAPKTRVVNIELGAVQDADTQEMRAIFGLDNDPNSPNFGKTTGLMMSDRDVIIRIAVRQGNGWPVIQDLTFKKTQNRNHASYKGQITIPVGGSGRYTISGILLREAGDGGVQFVSVRQLFDKPQANLSEQLTMASCKNPHGAIGGFGVVVVPNAVATTLDMPIPYVTKWQPVVVEEGVARPVSLDFLPRGTLLRMRIRNDHTESRTFHRVKFVTTAFTLSGDFVQARENPNGDIAWQPWNTETITLNIPNGIEVAGKVGDQPSYSRWMYRWVMPRSLNFVAKETVASLALTADAIDYSLAFQTNQALSNGSVPLTLVYNEGHQGAFAGLEEGPTWGATASVINPLLRVSKGVLNVTKNGLVINNPVNTEDANVLYQRITQMSEVAPITVDGVVYHVPSDGELAAIFPREFDRSGYGKTKNSKEGQYTKGVLEHDVQLANLTKSFKADYYVASKTVTYGLRLQDQSNQYRTAFKYEVKNYDTPQAALVVSAILVGNESLTIDDIKEDAFWQTRAAQVEERVFPAYGSKTLSGNMSRRNQLVMFPAKTKYDEGATYIAYAELFSGLISPLVTGGAEIRSLPVFLFNNN